MLKNQITNAKRIDMQHGFTLLELMITIAIISILTSIAIPSYSIYMIEGKIPDATSNLATKRVKNEQFFQDNRTYTGADVSPGGCVNDTISSQYFTFSCAVNSSLTYTIVATGVRSMTGFQFSIDQSNTKQTLAVPSGWALPATNNCWIKNNGGGC